MKKDSEFKELFKIALLGIFLVFFMALGPLAIPLLICFVMPDLAAFLIGAFLLLLILLKFSDVLFPFILFFFLFAYPSELFINWLSPPRENESQNHRNTFVVVIAGVASLLLAIYRSN